MQSILSVEIKGVLSVLPASITRSDRGFNMWNLLGVFCQVPEISKNPLVISGSCSGSWGDKKPGWWFTKPLNIGKSIRMMRFPIYGKMQTKCSSHHQPAMVDGTWFVFIIPRSHSCLLNIAGISLWIKTAWPRHDTQSHGKLMDRWLFTKTEY